MSQASIPTPPNSMANAAGTKPVLTLTDMVDSAAVNLKRVEFAKSALGAAIFMFTAVIVVILIDHWVWALPAWVRWLCLGSIMVGTFYWMLRRVVPMFGRRINPIYAAREIERKVPELKDSLVSYMQLNESQNAAPKGVVTAVGKYAVDRLSRHDIGEFIASTTPLKLAMWLLATIVFSSVYFVVSPKSGFDSSLRLVMPWNKIEVPTRVKIVKLTPKDAVVARGQTLDIDIELRGHVNGDKVQIEFSTLDGQFVDQVIPMEPVIEGLTYQGKLKMGDAGIEQPLEYKVRAGDSVAGPYLVEVEIVPLVAVEKLELSFPPYTKLPPRTIEEPGDFEAIEGTKVRVFAQANQKMDSGRIEVNPLAQENDEINIRQLVGLQTNDRQLNGSFQLQLNKKKDDPSAGSYRLTAISALGQPNADPIIYPYLVAADQAPIIEWADDYPDVVELPINHVGDFKVKAYDKDFRLSHLRTSLYRGRSKLDDAVLLHNEEGINATVERTWRFEPMSMGLRPGDQLTLQAFASDNRRDLQNTRWEPNVSSTSILKILIKPESNEPTDNSAPKDQAEPLPDQPVDGSDVEQPSEDSSKTADTSKDDATNDQKGEDSGASDGSEKGEQQNGADAPEEGSEQNDAASSNNTGSEKNEQKGSGQDGSGENSPKQDTSTSQESSSGNPPESGENGDKQSNNGQNGETKSTGNASKSESENSNNPSTGNQDSAKQPSNDSQSQDNKNQGSETNANQKQSGNQQQGSGKGQSGNQQQGSSEQQNGSGEQQPSKSDQTPQSMQQGNEGGQGEQNGSESGSAGEQSGEGGAGQESSNGQEGNNSQSSGTGGDSANNKSSSSNSEPSNGGTPQENGGNPANANPSGNSREATGNSQSASNSNSSDSSDTQSANTNAGQQSNSQGNSNASSNSKPSPVNNNAPNKSQANGQSKSSNDSKGRLDDVSQANSDSKPPADDGSAFEEIKKWMDKNGPPKPNNKSGESGSGNQPKDASTGEGEGSQESSGDKKSQDNAASSDAQGGDQSTGASQSTSKSGDQQSGSDQSAASGESKEAGATESMGNPKSQGPNPSQSASQQSGRAGTAGNVSDSGSGTGPAEGSYAGPNTPSEANLEYTKELTDMALEYLDRQRDQPDPELLKRLGWSADDLRNFVDRWKAAKERGITPDGLKQDYMQDLRALGLTPNSASKRVSQGTDDKVRGLSEEGGRSKPPRSLQGQYEAFRKAAQQKATKE